MSHRQRKTLSDRWMIKIYTIYRLLFCWHLFTELFIQKKCNNILELIMFYILSTDLIIPKGIYSGPPLCNKIELI